MPRPRSPAVFVFAQHGCPACDEFLPRFKQLAGGAPFPVGVYHLGDGGRGDELATALKINATPTTVVMTRGGKFLKKVGAIADRALQTLLNGV